MLVCTIITFFSLSFKVGAVSGLCSCLSVISSPSEEDDRGVFLEQWQLTIPHKVWQWLRSQQASLFVFASIVFLGSQQFSGFCSIR